MCRELAGRQLKNPVTLTSSLRVPSIHSHQRVLFLTLVGVNLTVIPNRHLSQECCQFGEMDKSQIQP